MCPLTLVRCFHVLTSLTFSLSRCLFRRREPYGRKKQNLKSHQTLSINEKRKKTFENENLGSAEARQGDEKRLESFERKRKKKENRFFFLRYFPPLTHASVVRTGDGEKEMEKIEAKRERMI